MITEKVFFLAGVLLLILFIYCLLKEHRRLDELESKFKIGDKAKVEKGFYENLKGEIVKMRPAPALTIPIVTYSLKTDSGEILEISASNLEKL